MKTQTKITLVLLVFTLFCIGMELSRMYRSYTLSYIFLLWNLVLAWVPYLLSLKFVMYNLTKQKIAVIGTLLLWVLFLPNGPYIITDLVHLRPRISVPMWYDVLLVSTVAWNGLLLTLLSVRNMHRKLEDYYSPHILWCGLFLLFLSSGYGIYLGRFLRLNSWDFFLQPVRLLHYSLIDLVHPFHHPAAVWVTIIVCILLSFSYTILYLIGYPSKADNETI